MRAKVQRKFLFPFKFIDLFSGIGGLRIPFDELGYQCVWACEIDKFARMTYKENFDIDDSFFAEDIRDVDISSIPDHDLLLAGFPCQPFSIAGVSKLRSLGYLDGLKNEDKGNLFYYIVEILKEKKPAAFLLENVKHLLHHDKGRTWNIIYNSLIELGYCVYYKVIDAKLLVPQHRERVFIIGFKNKSAAFRWPKIPDTKPKLKDILDYYVDAKYTISDKLWKYLQNYKLKHEKMGNGFGYGLAELNGITRTLSARYYKDGSEILIPQDGRNPRKLTPNECRKLMGFPSWFKIPVSDTQAYKQFGNAVVVPIVRYLAYAIDYALTHERDTVFTDRGIEHVRYSQ